MSSLVPDQERLLAAFRTARISAVVTALAQRGFFSSLDGARSVAELADEMDRVDPDRLAALAALLVSAGLLRPGERSDIGGEDRIVLEEHILAGPEHPGALERWLVGGDLEPWTPDFIETYLRCVRLDPRSCGLISRLHGLEPATGDPRLAVVSTAPQTWAESSSAAVVVEVPVRPGTGHLDAAKLRAALRRDGSPVDLVFHNVVHYQSVDTLLRAIDPEDVRSLLVVDVFVAEDGENSEFVLDWLTHGGPCVHACADLIALLSDRGWRPHRSARLGVLDHLSFVSP